MTEMLRGGDRGWSDVFEVKGTGCSPSEPAPMWQFTAICRQDIYAAKTFIYMFFFLKVVVRLQKFGRLNL